MFETIDKRQHAEVKAMLSGLGRQERADLVSALGATRALLDPPLPKAFTIRPFRSGDMGLIAARQTLLYKETQGWDRGMEILQGESTTAFLRNFKPDRENCWVAEANGVMAGSVLLTDEGRNRARLRLLYVEPFARGRGIGTKLVETCLAFARDANYAAMTLWTHTILESARRIYAAHGFELVETKMHEAFGTPVQGETWRLDLRQSTEPAA